ncbi:MAG TPA: DUF998 domain-containing protein [Acidimicrobiia bacterium]
MARARLVLIGIVGSVVSLAVAPLLMPSTYSWITHTTSESAAQGVQGAWVARLGFALFGLSVMVLVTARAPTWGRWASTAHAVFGLMMVVTATASVRPWEAGVSFDAGEDGIHSFAATAMGFAFAGGVALTSASRLQKGGRILLLDICAVIASVAIPLLMVAFDDSSGLLQRVMFLVAYAWYGREGLMAFPQSSDQTSQQQGSISSVSERQRQS